jgi:hypothetical protein
LHLPHGYFLPLRVANSLVTSGPLRVLLRAARQELLSRVDTYLDVDVPRDLSEDERLRVPRAVWFLTVGGGVLGM